MSSMKKEEELKDNERKLQLIIENTNDLIAITEFSLKAKFLYVNPSYERVLGYSPTELIGKSSIDFICPEDAKKLLPLIMKYMTIKAKQLVTGKEERLTEQMEYRLPVKSGGWRFMEATATLVGDQVVFVSRDVTDRKKALEALAQSEERYRDTVEGSEDLMTRCDGKGNFIFVNSVAEKIFGVKPVDCVGRSAFDFVYSEDRERTKKAFNEWIQQKVERVSFENRQIGKSGQTFDMLWNIIIKYTPSGDVISVESFARDITERQRREAEFQSLLKSMINAFVIFDSVFDDKGNFISYRFVYINDSYERITGVKNDEVKGKTVHEVWPDTEPEWIKRYGEVAVTGVPQEFELYHDPTKKMYYCHVYRPWEWKDRFCVVFEDITERQKMEEENRKRLHELEIFYKASIGREERILELKKEIEKLKKASEK